MPAAGADPPFRRIAIAGLGLIGGSIAARLRQTAPAVRLIGLDTPSVLDRARARGLIDEAAVDLAGIGADLLIVATPIGAAIDLLRAAGAARLGALVTDTCSTKRQVLAAAAEARLPRFVGGHPMAGAEHAGLDHADADLFGDRPWLLVADDPQTPDARALAALVGQLGASASFVDASWHDRTMAYVSHVPQLLAVALMNAAGTSCGDAGLAAAGRAFLEMTRLASSPGGLWADIVGTNADNIEEALGALAAELPSGAALHDLDRLRASFTRAREWRARAAAVAGLPS
jgi:prephenate dehydrogenase